jgi:iron(III) transport system ATP-binding protein
MSTRGSPMVEIDHLGKNFGNETVVRDLSLSVAQGEFVTLLGPSGCGKTTTLRCIAGLERPDRGEIRIGGDTVVAPGRDIYLNPEQRNIGMVFQSYAVWPHMTVFDNVAFGLRVRRASAGVIKEKTTKALELVGLGHLADRYATKLSGGQRQRVALARAIVYEPRVVLFDEPLSNLDAKLREQMRVELVRLQHEVGITSIYVTHDQSEALVMSDRVVVMNHGVIQQIDDPQTIYARPANAFVANFIGVANLIEGVLLGRDGDLCSVEVALGAAHPPLRLRAVCAEGGAQGGVKGSTGGAKGAVPGQKLILMIRPEDIALHLRKPAGEAGPNVFSGEVIDTVYLGNFLECRVRVGAYEINIQIDHFEQLDRGQTVFLSFHPDHGLCLTD